MSVTPINILSATQTGEYLIRLRFDDQSEQVRLRQYDMTVHALEEMAEDGLDIVDMEHAVLAGRVVRIDRDDPRGNKHVIEGRLRTV